MSGTCFSLATILRCESLTTTETAVLLVPPGLELIFVIGLIKIKWGSGRKHWILAAEGWFYFLLSLLDYLSHTIHAARTSLAVFKVFDIVIGSMSFVPIMLYVVFLFLMSRSDLVPTLPNRFQKLAKYILLLLIPVTVAMNELGSFLGVSYRAVSDANHSTILAIGFASSHDQTLWIFASTLTLALFTAFQALIFSLVFYKLIMALIDQRRIDTSSREDSEVHLIKGTGWVAAGVKLGAIETVVGFAGPFGGGFGTVLARKLLKMLARACLIIGVVKGMDYVENFSLLENKTSEDPNSRPKMRFMISNPRNSTFARLSPRASAFHAQPRATAGSPLIPSTHYANTVGSRKAAQRVTLRYDGHTPPQLEMRLSDLNMPSPTDITQHFKERGSFQRRTSTQGTVTMVSNDTSPYPPPHRPPLVAYQGRNYSENHGRPRFTRTNSSLRYSSISNNSITSDSLSVVREIAAQFPGLPPRVTNRTRSSTLDRVQEESLYDHRSAPFRSHTPGNSVSSRLPMSMMTWDIGSKRDAPTDDRFGTSWSTLGDSQKSLASKKSSSLKRKAVPLPPPIDSRIAAMHTTTQLTSHSSTTSGGSSAYDTMRSRRYSNNGFNRNGGMSTGLTTGSGTAETPITNPFALEQEYKYRSSESLSSSLGRGRVPGQLAARAVALQRNKEDIIFAALSSERQRKGSMDGLKAAAPVEPRVQAPTPQQRRAYAGDAAGPSTMETDLLTGERPSTIEVARRANFETAWLTADRARVKGVGQVARRRTPTPTRSVFTRDSMEAEHQLDYFSEMKPASHEESARLRDLPRRDSDILGERSDVTYF